MRLPLIRLGAVVVGVVVVISCDSGPVGPRFGNGISGGPTGTAPIAPRPGGVDTNPPFVRIDTPAVGQLINVGDSLLVVVRLIDDRKLSNVTITGFDYSGDVNLGTFVRTVRYGTVVAPVGPAFPPGLTDTVIRRYLQPASPLDTTVDSLIVMAIGQDSAGNVDTVTTRVNIVTGPKLSITAPIAGDSVPRGLAMAVSVRATHPDGVASVSIRVLGEATWPTPLDQTITQTFPAGTRDTVMTVSVNIPANAPLRGRITIQATAVDVNRNPGSTAPLLVFVRDVGTLPPRVFQTVPGKLEAFDSVTITANGDGIQSIGLILRDSNGVVIPGGDTITFTAPFVSNQVARLGIQLGLGNQGQRIGVQSFAVDAQGRIGYSIQQGTNTPSTNPLSAFTDTTLVTFGQTFKFPAARAGVAGDLAVDPVRGSVLISNTNFNILEVWNNAGKTFQTDGVAVGSLPWGLFISNNPDELLVANSGATTISRVCIGNCPGGLIREDLNRRIRTRELMIFQVTYVFDPFTGKVRLDRLPDIAYSDRPQFVAQSSGGRVYFSTRPTEAATPGTLRWLDPALPFPDPKQINDYGSFGGDANQFAIFNADSIRIIKFPPNSVVSDRIIIYDHPYGQFGPVIRNIGNDSIPDDAVFKVNAQGGDVELENGFLITSLGLTDTTFVAASGDRNWIGFGEGNTNGGVGRIMMVNDPPGPIPLFFSPATAVTDIGHNAAEPLFGMAIDRTGLQVTAHGLQTYVAALDDPYHLRLDGVYDSFDNGAGVAYHPNAQGTASAPNDRVLFTATQSGVIEIVDVAHYNNRGRLVTKGNLYGPLRATGPLPGDNVGLVCPGDPNCIVVKVYGLTTVGLVVIDLRQQDIKAAVP